AAEKECSIALAAVERPMFPAAAEPVAMEAAAVALAKGSTVQIDVKKPPAQQPLAAQEPVEVPADAAPQPPRKARVVLYAAAFAVAPDLLVTAASALEGADDITVQSGDGAGRAGRCCRGGKSSASNWRRGIRTRRGSRPQRSRSCARSSARTPRSRRRGPGAIPRWRRCS